MKAENPGWPKESGMKKFLLTGHVDHGKSTLGGHLLYRCGAFDEREAQKVFEEAEADKMSSFRWARLLDTDTHEKERGVTVDCNECDFIHQGQSFRLIDTPGHKLFVPHLIEAIYRNQSGDKGVVGVLVLSALPGELEPSLAQGQVKEDVLLLRAIGVENLVVAINKMDRLDWDGESFESSRKKILPLLKAARFKNVRFCATSGWAGLGLVEAPPLRPACPQVRSLLDEITDLSALETWKEELPERKVIPQVEEFWADAYILNCQIFSPGFWGVLHSRAGESTFEVVRIEQQEGKEEKKTRPRPFIKSGDRAFILLRVGSPLALRKGERIVLRDKNGTVGYGLVASR